MSKVKARKRFKPRVQTFFDAEKFPSRTDKSHKDQCDINRILDKAKRTGVLSHLAKHEGVYGDFAGFDFEDAQNMIARANSIFYDLDSEVRAEFGNKPSAFFDFVNNPNNKDRLAELVPGLVEPGAQLPDVLGGGGPGTEPPAIAPNSEGAPSSESDPGPGSSEPSGEAGTVT